MPQKQENNSANIIPVEIIENKILLIRGQKVMLDRDLANLYNVETRILIQAVKRNKKRFPDDFMFQLFRMEAESLVSQNVISLRSQNVILKKANKRGLHIKYLPYVFTEQGVAMLSSVLKSKKAVEINIMIMRVFVKIRRMASSYKDLAKRIERLEKSQDMHGKRFSEVFRILDNLGKEEKSNKIEIGFKG